MNECMSERKTHSASIHIYQLNLLMDALLKLELGDFIPRSSAHRSFQVLSHIAQEIFKIK